MDTVNAIDEAIAKLRPVRDNDPHPDRRAAATAAIDRLLVKKQDVAFITITNRTAALVEVITELRTVIEAASGGTIAGVLHEVENYIVVLQDEDA
jgi:hypothetical protein